jgi:hypothetical protein
MAARTYEVTQILRAPQHNIRSSAPLQAITGFFVQDALTTSTDIGPVSIGIKYSVQTTQPLWVDSRLFRISIEVMG